FPFSPANNRVRGVLSSGVSERDLEQTGRVVSRADFLQPLELSCFLPGRMAPRKRTGRLCLVKWRVVLPVLPARAALLRPTFIGRLLLPSLVADDALAFVLALVVRRIRDGTFR